MTIPASSDFLEPDDPSLAAMVGDAAVHLLVDRGIGELSSRAIAGHLGITPSALTQQANRGEQVRLLVVSLGRRWLRWSGGCHGSGLPAQLPQAEDERHGVRVWAAVAELTRGEQACGNPGPALVLSQFLREETAQVAWSMTHRLERRPDADEVAATMALVTGLRHELSVPEPQVTADQAVRLLREHVDRIEAAGYPVRSA